MLTTCCFLLLVQKAIAEEEIVQRAALDLLVRKKAVGNSKGIEQIAADYDIIVGSSGKIVNMHRHTKQNKGSLWLL